MKIAENPRYLRSIEKARELIDAGFPSKAAQKSAMQYLSRAYEVVRDDILFGGEDGLAHQSRDNLLAEGDYQVADAALPFDLHQFRDRKPGVAVLAERKPDHLALIQELARLRDTAKGMPIAPVVKPDDPIAELTKQIEAELTERMQANPSFDASKELSERVKLPASGFPHVVTNSHGTTFLRWKYYLAGRVTALNTIVAISEMKSLEADGKAKQAAELRAAIEKTDPVALRLVDQCNETAVDKALRRAKAADSIEGVTAAVESAGRK